MKGVKNIFTELHPYQRKELPMVDCMPHGVQTAWAPPCHPSHINLYSDQRRAACPTATPCSPSSSTRQGCHPPNTTRSHLIKWQVSSSACMNGSFVHGQHCNSIELECVLGWRWETEPSTGMEMAVFFGPVRTLLCWPDKGWFLCC